MLGNQAIRQKVQGYFNTMRITEDQDSMKAVHWERVNPHNFLAYLSCPKITVCISSSTCMQIAQGCQRIPLLWKCYFPCNPTSRHCVHNTGHVDACEMMLFVSKAVVSILLAGRKTRRLAFTIATFLPFFKWIGPFRRVQCPETE